MYGLVTNFMTVASCILSFISTLLPLIHHFHRKFHLAKIKVYLLLTAATATFASWVTYTIAPKMLNEVFYGWSYATGWLSVVKVTLFSLIIMEIHVEDDS